MEETTEQTVGSYVIECSVIIDNKKQYHVYYSDSQTVSEAFRQAQEDCHWSAYDTFEMKVKGIIYPTD